ncbi:HAMP domain-containing histidine kinase [Candidatus Saccharibacteria bacterium]|nr:HAMP domain-containing histidine kinase [Candidatus Saccharibacteria bacterium]
MFKKLRNRIIIITMAITTVVLVLSGVLIMLFSSATRPEPRPMLEINISNSMIYDDQDLKEFIHNDRKEGSQRLLITLLCVGAIIEVAVFLIIYYTSQKIIEPVEESYDKQKIFIANASHELKTPLAVIQANMEALEVDKSNEKWKDNIETEISHANKLVLDLLQLAKMDAGSVDATKPEEVDLKQEIEKRIEIFKPKFAGKIIFKNSIKNGVMLLSRQDILQILDILMDNATKYGDKKVMIYLCDGEIVVSNDGAGILKDDLEKVFDRFYQTDKTKDGSGLGLAIAKAICERNGWGIKCESDKRLTRFIVTIHSRNK